MNAFFAKLINYLNGSGWWVSFNVHSWFACTVVYHTARLNGHLGLIAGTFLGLAAVKEYYWDKHFEVPNQSFLDSSIDFGSYAFGVALAVALAHT